MNCTDVYLVYNRMEDRKKLEEENFKSSPFFHFIDDQSHFTKGTAYKLKSEWGAKLTPFGLVFDKDKPIKAFYSEASNNVINDLINFIKVCH